MLDSRRRLLAASGIALTDWFLRSPAVAGQATDPSAQPSGHHHGQQSDESGAGPAAVAAATKSMLEKHEKDIKKNVEKLFELATDLKTEVEKTDSTVVLSVAMLKKTEEIEKLARQIHDLAKD